MEVIANLRRNNFDTLRLFFAVLVVYSHSYPLMRGSNATEPLYWFTHGVMAFGEVSVWSFFAISGFLITQSWQRSPKIGRFLRRRVSRIYPGFIVATLLCAVVVYPIAADPGRPHGLNVLSYVASTLRLQMFPDSDAFVHNPGPGTINGSLWSIPFEFWCYIGVLVLGLTALLRRRWVVVCLFLLASTGHLIMLKYHLAPGGKILGKIFGFPVFWGNVLPFFLAGMLVQLYADKIRLRPGYAALAAIGLIGSFFIPYGYVYALPVLGTYLLMWLAYLPALNFLNLGRWGDFSYGTYLYAFPIQQLLVFYFLANLSPVGLFMVAAPLSVLAGVLSWHGVEKHFLPKKTVRRLEEKVEESRALNPAEGGAG